MAKDDANRIDGFFEEDDASASNDSFYSQSDSPHESGGNSPDSNFMEAFGQAFGIDPMEALGEGGKSEVHTPMGVIKLSLDSKGELMLTAPGGGPAAPELVAAFCRMLEVLQHMPPVQQMLASVPGLKAFMQHLTQAAAKVKEHAEGLEGEHELWRMARGLFNPPGLSFGHLTRLSYQN